MEQYSMNRSSIPGDSNCSSITSQQETHNEQHFETDSIHVIEQ